MSNSPIIVSGLPLATPDQTATLMRFLLRKIEISWTLGLESRIYMPLNDQGHVRGFAVLKFKSEEKEREALRLDGVAMDRHHTIAVSYLRDSALGIQAMEAGHIDPVALDSLKEIDTQAPETVTPLGP